MINRIALALAAGLAATTVAHAAPIEGKWRTQSGANASIAKCGGAFCIRITSGAHAGKTVGRVSGSGSKYSGSARVNGNTLKLSGCVAKVLCRTQTWSRR